MRISENISYLEGVRSNTAKRRGIRNKPNYEQLQNMQQLADKVFQPLREWVGGAIRINSFFRSPALNRAIGGSSRSQHCKGQAIDLDDTYGFKTNKEMFWFIVNNLEYDQIIYEYGTANNPDWVHVSYVSESKNRNRILRCRRRNGKAHYTHYTIEQAKIYIGL